MSINPITSGISQLLSGEAIRSETGAAGSFADIFTKAMNTAAASDTADKASGLELLTGQADDMSGLLLDAQKAEISLNLALQLRNKAIDAYSEIMRMQV